MAGHYEAWLTTDAGLRIADRGDRTILGNFLWLSAARVTNAIGHFRMRLPISFDTRLIKSDRIVQIWRAPSGSRLSLWRPYFIRGWRYETLGNKETIVIYGPDVNDLLRRRIVAAHTSSSQASKTDYADDMMKEIVTEALADGIDPTPDAGTRVWDNLNVQSDLGLGPTLTKEFAWGRLLSISGSGVLPGIARAAREAGTEVFFDIVPNAVSSTSITFEFRTYIDQPGRDVTDLGVMFDRDLGSLKNPFLEHSYEDEENYIYAIGRGAQVSRETQQIYDSDRYSTSIWARCEGIADARDQSVDNGVREAGRSVLEGGRPRRTFGGTPVDTAGSRFGVDWKFGYKVKAYYREEGFDAIVRAVTINVDNRGNETVQARLEYRE